MHHRHHRWKYVCTVVWTAIALFQSLHGQKATIIFRMDDIVLQPDSIQDEVLQLFKRHGVPLTWGVIPFSDAEQARGQTDSRYLNTLRKAIEKGELEIALHGFSHTRRTGTALKTEFAGLSLQEQSRLLNKGKSYLEDTLDISTPFFIPPWNTYDKNTLVALSSSGFEGISADLGGVSLPNGLAYLPATKIDFADWNELLRLSNEKQGVIIVLFHSYTFADSRFTLRYLDSLLARTVANGNTCLTFSGYVRHTKRFPSSDRYRINAKLRYSRWFFFLSNRQNHWVFLERSWIYTATLVALILALVGGAYVGVRTWVRT